MAYAAKIHGDRGENIERAIGHCTAAIDGLAPGAEDWATNFILLGQLYRERRFGNPAHNFMQAADAFAIAARAREADSDADPYETGLLWNSLGVTALRQAMRNDSYAAAMAVEAFQKSLEFLDRDRHPHQWAMTQNNLGLALTLVPGGDASSNIEEAIAAHLKATEVLDRERFPVDWAHAQHNLGQAYTKRVAGERPDTLRKAAERFRAALEVLAVERLPADHRSTSGRLGDVEAMCERWAAAHEAYASAAVADDVLLMEVSTGPHGFDSVAQAGHAPSELDAYALARIGREAEALEAIERSRARWLAQALSFQGADPSRIRDPDRRERYLAARDELAAAQAAAQNIRWSGSKVASELDLGRTDAAADRSMSLALAQAVRAARDRLDSVVAEIRRERDPAGFLDLRPDMNRILSEVDHPVVYLLSNPWGGLALAARTTGNGQHAVTQCALPGLTDDWLTELIQVLLDDGSRRVVGGYAHAQEGHGLDLLTDGFDGETFAQKAAALHDACVRGGVRSTLDAAAQVMLKLRGLDELVNAPFSGLGAEQVSRLGGTLGDLFLRAELRRCLPKLAEVVMTPVTAWLRDQGITDIVLVPCGLLPIFPLLAVTTDDGQSIVAELVSASVAPSAQSVAARNGGTERRSGVSTLGDPRPTRQELPWAEAEALTIAALAGDPGRGRVREQATREWLIESLRTAQVVVACCHGVLDRDFLRSRLILAQGQTLSLGQALAGEPGMDGLRLLVLSACQTAVSNLRAAYEEVRSLAVGMLQAGARAVLASLWPVDDHATYLLMIRFMQEWLPVIQEEEPARALIRAQVWLRTVTNRELRVWTAQVLDSKMPGAPEASGNQTGQEMTTVCGGDDQGGPYGAQADATPYADPIFWAGFEIVGS